ncbi:MAG: DUF3618 domain-containing protein [Myxococcota bacterium]
MSRADEIQQEIEETREQLDEVAEELGDRIEDMAETANPQQAPFQWGPFAALAATGVGLLLVTWLLKR